jgi:predicted transcriptional regulator of viral defense system
METKVDTPWPAVAELAARQHGVVSVQELLAHGVGRGAIKKLAASGRLHRIYRGVYAWATGASA